MPEECRTKWNELPDCGDYASVDTVYSLCHNCFSILEESKSNVNVRSLWELILSDETFQYPDFSRVVVTIQDCWRSMDRKKEQDAVRDLPKKMNFKVVELDDNREQTNFCGVSLYHLSPKRNLELAPKRYLENAQGKFLPHTKEEQAELMRQYCTRFKTPNVVDYCHYCQEGLEIYDESIIAELIQLPEGERITALIALGYPENAVTQIPHRKDVDELLRYRTK